MRQFRVSWFLLIPAAILVTVAVSNRVAAPQPGTADPTEAWCAAGAGGYHRATEAGALLLGMHRYSESRAEEAYADPLWSAACGIAYDLWGLTEDQTTWCADERTRETDVADAVSLLGLGEDEAAGVDAFREAPGDSPAEYVQACRYAFAREGGDVAPNPTGLDEGFSHLANAWCVDHPDTKRQAEETLGMPVSAESNETQRRLVNDLACRIGFRIAQMDGLPRRVAPAPTQDVSEVVTLETTYVNEGATAVRVREASGSASGGGIVPPCTVTQGTATYQLPVEVGVATGTEDAFATVRSIGEVPAGGRLKLLITIAEGGSVQVHELSGADIVPESAC